METTVIIRGVEFNVEFDYEPPEAEVRYYPDGSGHPGCPENIEITKITHGETDFTSFFENEYELIEEIVSNKI